MFLRLLVVGILAIAIVPAVWAAEIPIRNGGFEELVLNCAPGNNCFTSGAPGWSGLVFTWKAPSTVFSNIPEGVNVAEVSGSSISQALTATLQGDTVYTLTFYVGHESNKIFPGYKVELLAGTTAIASDASLLPGSGQFSQGRLVFQSVNADPALIGQPLTIRISGTSSGLLDFDNITLDATSGPDVTPTPFSGAASQFASGGGWKTTLTFVNLNTTQTVLHLSFISDNGQPLTVPVVVTPVIPVLTSPTSTIDVTIPVMGTLIVESEAGSTISLGWAQVMSSAPIAGFAIFRLHGSSGVDSEGTTPVDNVQTSLLTLPFDDTGGFMTGVALTNPTSVQVTVSAKIVDENGIQIGLQALTLPPMGHSSFFLPERFIVTTGRHGIVQFQNAAGGAISGIGLRFSPSGSFTSIPVIPR